MAKVSFRAEGVAKRGASIVSSSARVARSALVAFLWFAGKVGLKVSCVEEEDEDEEVVVVVVVVVVAGCMVEEGIYSSCGALQCPR